MSTLWKKDNVLIKDNNTLIKCDRCPCSGWNYEVYGYGVREDPGTTQKYEWFLNFATLKIGDYIHSLHSNDDGAIIVFENAPGPTKEQSISGTLYVEVGGPCDEIMISMGGVGPNGEAVFTDLYWQKNANNNDISKKFTIRWNENGDNGASYYLSWY